MVCPHCRSVWTIDADGMQRYTCPDCKGRGSKRYQADMGFEQSNWQRYESTSLCNKCFGKEKLERPYDLIFGQTCPNCLKRP
jgi:DnaJ-class molecular chaperone